jgi:PKD repeat protein/pimeloyl-ACP methyl ester carboxylesterase
MAYSRKWIVGLSFCFMLSLVGFSVSKPVLIQFCPSLNQLVQLVEDDPQDLMNREGRTPLILIHGIFGTEDLNHLDDAYWRNFLTYFKSTPALYERFKVYRFHYLSNTCQISDLARGLGQQIDQMIRRGKLEDKPLVIIAHSMGGLIARAYMSSYTHKGIGKYAGQLGGERVLKLITLATPHHGTPAANKKARDALATQSAVLYGWMDALKFSDIAFWCSGGLSSCDNALVPNLPNRSAVRYDNFDQALPPSEYETSSERNDWLIKLNSKDPKNPDRRYDEKIIAYYGYIDPEDPYRLYLSDWYEGASRITGILTPIISFPYATVFNYHLGLIASNVLMDMGLSHTFPLNDGLVPVLSGSFYGYQIGGRRMFIGYDHLDMKDGKIDKFGEIPLFESIENDLLDLTTRAVISVSERPVATSDTGIQGPPAGNNRLVPASHCSTPTTHCSFPALTPLVFNGMASTTDTTQNILSYSWDFGDGFTGTGEVIEHAYLVPGTYKVTLTVQTSLGDKNSATIWVNIHNPQIYVVPDTAWTRRFSISESPSIASYTWDFGDGTPPVHAAQVEHTYAQGGYYKVSLTLTFAEDPLKSVPKTLQITTNVTVGVGPTVVPDGTLSSNETWLALGSPYLIHESVTVAEGATLTLEPGTVIQFSPKASLIVKGTLKALGTEDQKIIFTSYRDASFGRIRERETGGTGMKEGEETLTPSPSLPAPGDWGQIYFSNTSVDSLLTHAVIQYGQNNVQISGSSPILTHSLIRYGAENGIYLSENSKALLSQNIISDNQTGMTVLASSPDITQNTFENNRHIGLRVDAKSSPRITHNRFNQNEIALDITYGQDMNVMLLNNEGLTVKDVARVRGTVSSNTIWSNKMVYTIDKTGLAIAPTGILALAPGSIVKGYPESFLIVRGILLTDGTYQNRVVFTSIKDDTLGGDTNGDGDATRPSPGDWKGIDFQNPEFGATSGALRYCVIRYADKDSIRDGNDKEPDKEKVKDLHFSFMESLDDQGEKMNDQSEASSSPGNTEEELNSISKTSAVFSRKNEDPGLKMEENRGNVGNGGIPLALQSAIFDLNTLVLTPGAQNLMSRPFQDPASAPLLSTPIPPVSTPMVPVATPAEWTPQPALPLATPVSSTPVPIFAPLVSLPTVAKAPPSVPTPIPSSSLSPQTPDRSRSAGCGTPGDMTCNGPLLQPTPDMGGTNIISETPQPSASPLPVEASTPVPLTPTPESSPLVVSWGTSEDIPVPEDYDGDNKADLAVWRPTNATWYVLLSSASGRSDISGVLTQVWGSREDKPISADYDGDGRSDIAVWRPQTQKWLILNSSGGISIKQRGKNNRSHGFALPLWGDYNGDGIMDVALWHSSADQSDINMISLNKLIVYKWSTPGDIPISGDFDGDGKSEIAVWRPSEGAWYIPFSSAGSMILPWGSPGDIPVPADYDGDNQTDIAVWRPGEGTWYILLSSKGIFIQPLGRQGDIPVPADYDGDKKADLAVWRPQDGTWYIFLSSHSSVISDPLSRITDGN